MTVCHGILGGNVWRLYFVSLLTTGFCVCFVYVFGLPDYRILCLFPLSVALCQSAYNLILCSFVVCFVNIFGLQSIVFCVRLFCLHFRLHFVSLQIILFFVRSSFVLFTFSVSRPTDSVFVCFVCTHKYDTTRDEWGYQYHNDPHWRCKNFIKGVLVLT